MGVTEISKISVNVTTTNFLIVSKFRWLKSGWCIPVDLNYRLVKE